MNEERQELWRGLAHTRDGMHGPGRVNAPDGVRDEDVRRMAATHGLSLLQAQREVCAADCMPLRYSRNATTVSPSDQIKLLDAHVLLVGLGGLGGHILDMLARMGVGHITGVDGDTFEESNANRQLLCTATSLGGSKATAAAKHVALVNDAVTFTAVPHFAQGADFAPLVAQADVVVDALGGLRHRAALHAAAKQAGKTVVSAGIAGLTGWLAVVPPEGSSPVSLLEGSKDGTSGTSSTVSPPAPPSAEELLGNLAPTVATAAALQCTEILKLLTGRPALEGLLLFDLADQSFTKIRL